MPTVLVADDSATIRQVVRMALKGSPYEVVEAENGDQTIEMAEDEPDLILLDYHLPDISGVEICRQLKSQTATRDIPILMLEGDFHDTEAESALKIGAKAIIQKPFETDELLKPIRKTIGSGDTDKQEADETKQMTEAADESAQWADRIRQKAKEKAKELDEEPQTKEPAQGGEAEDESSADVEATKKFSADAIKEQIEDEQAPSEQKQSGENAQKRSVSEISKDELKQSIREELESSLEDSLQDEISDQLEKNVSNMIDDYLREGGEELLSNQVEKLVENRIMPDIEQRVKKTVDEAIQKKFDALSNQLDKKVQQFVHREIKSLLSE